MIELKNADPLPLIQRNLLKEEFDIRIVKGLYPIITIPGLATGKLSVVERLENEYYILKEGSRNQVIRKTENPVHISTQFHLMKLKPLTQNEREEQFTIEKCHSAFFGRRSTAGMAVFKILANASKGPSEGDTISISIKGILFADQTFFE